METYFSGKRSKNDRVGPRKETKRYMRRRRF
jgi:hypothetical protein